MTVRSLCGWTALSLVLTGPAVAAPATPEEAQRLTSLFQLYVGKPAAGAPSAVAVSPTGDSYRVELDLVRLMAPLGSFGLNVASTGPYAVTLTPQADGTWRVQGDGVPALAFTKGDQTTTLKYENYRSDGVYDTKLKAMREQTSSMTGLTGGTESPTVSNQQQYTAQVATRQTARDAGDGSISTEALQTAANLDYHVNMKAPTGPGQPEPPSFALGATAPSASVQSAVSHLSTTAVLDLWAFLVAHPTKTQLKADQDQLKALLRSVVAPGPLGSVRTEVSKLALVTPVGPFAMNAFKENVGLDGDRANQTVSLGLHYAGLTFPTDRIPAWAVKLVPTALDLDLAMGPFHLGDGLRKAVADLDLSADHPLTDAQAADIAHTFADPNALEVTLGASSATSALLTVKAQGSARTGAGGLPSSDLTVTAAGLDGTLSTLNGSAQDDPNAAQAAAVLTLAKQTAKATGPDLYSWTIHAQPGQPTTVNGTPLSQAAPPQPDAPTSP